MCCKTQQYRQHDVCKMIGLGDAPGGGSRTTTTTATTTTTTTMYYYYYYTTATTTTTTTTTLPPTPLPQHVLRGCQVAT